MGDVPSSSSPVGMIVWDVRYRSSCLGGLIKFHPPTSVIARNDTFDNDGRRHQSDGRQSKAVYWRSSWPPSQTMRTEAVVRSRDWQKKYSSVVTQSVENNNARYNINQGRPAEECTGSAGGGAAADPPLRISLRWIICTLRSSGSLVVSQSLITLGQQQLK